jgi:toxin ParE1/3/4
MRVVIMPAALREIGAVGDYIAADNPLRADSFVAEVYESCFKLANHAERYPLVPRFRGLGIRRRTHGAYLIFYRILPTAVEVLRVVHGARDTRNLDFNLP